MATDNEILYKGEISNMYHYFILHKKVQWQNISYRVSSWMVSL